MKHRICALVLVLALVVAAASAQPSETPSVAFLSFGTSPVPFSITETAILHRLVAGGFLSVEELQALDTRDNIEGENINVFALDAGWELDRLNIMVETALDRDADVLVAFTTPVAQAAVSTTLDMDDPPAVIFASVYYPYEAGVADAPCIKPSHVTGSQIVPPYALLVELVKKQQPDVSTIGTVFSTDQIAGVEGSRTVVELGEAQGLTVLESAVTQPIDFVAAVDGLASRGAEALILMIDTVTSRGLPAVVATASENLLPVYYPSLGGISSSAMISAGYYDQYRQGVQVGAMLNAYLRGELNIASTAIDMFSGDGVGVNLAVAASLDIEISTAILESADFIIGLDGVTFSQRLQEATASQEQLVNQPDSEADIQAYLESLHCTPEMIAEQQAEVDAKALVEE